MRAQTIITNQLRPTVYIPSGTPIEIVQQTVLAALQRELRTTGPEGLRAAA